MTDLPGIPSVPPWPPGSRAPRTPAEAAQLIADALNAGRLAGFDPYWDSSDGRMCCTRGTGPTFESAEVYEDYDRVWRVLD